MSADIRATEHAMEESRGEPGGALSGPDEVQNAPLAHCLNDTTRLGFSVAEVAQSCGVSEWTVREAVRRGQIAHIRLGDRIVIPRSAIDPGHVIRVEVDHELLADLIYLRILRNQDESRRMEMSVVKTKLLERGRRLW